MIGLQDETEDNRILDHVQTVIDRVKPFRVYALRTLRAVALIYIAGTLLKAQPFAVASPWSLGICIALLSAISMTKWISAIAVTMLLASALVPPVVAHLLTIAAP